MRSLRFGSIAASVVVTLAVSVSASAQGKSGNAPGKVNKSSAPPPSTSALSTPTTPATGAGPASPFAWMDDATVMEPHAVWLGVSMMRWQGSGVGETIVPVIDGAIGVSRRVQIGVSVPRVAGTVGTTFFSAKIAAFSDPARVFKLALAPTFELLSQAATVPGQRRTQWGLPVSMHVDGDAGRLYASSGYFSPGIWYAGAGFGKPITDRIGVSLSFSHAWATASAPAGSAPIDATRRNEISGGGSYDFTPNVSLFGSLGRTIGVAAQDGAGTTLSFGVSLTAGPLIFERR